MFAKEDDTEEKKMAMKVLCLGRKKKKRKKKPIAAFVVKNAAIDKNPMEGCSRVFETQPKHGP